MANDIGREQHRAEVTLTNDFVILKLRPKPTKMGEAFHLISNCHANHQLNVTFEGISFRHDNPQQYTWDSFLTFKSHLQNTVA